MAKTGGEGGRPDEALRAVKLRELKEEGKAAKEDAWRRARRGGMKTKGIRGRSYFELVGFEGDHPIYYETYNENAAISTGVNLLQPPATYGLDGAGITVGVWDAGSVKTTHQEFGGRVVDYTQEPNNPHATHVGGTIAASGVEAQAKGMAPSATLWSYFMSTYGTNDYAQMELVGASEPNQPDHLYLSNHSYGFVCGWTWHDDVPEWVGSFISPARDEKFGRYGPVAAAWDEACCNDPYYLPFKSAGNDRDDDAPAAGQSFYRWESAGPSVYQVWYVYDPNLHSPADGAWLSGYDTIPDVSTAKNIVTVGAVEDAVTDYWRDTAKAAMMSFSAWGPTDDGRIKPDIVANGSSLFSPSWFDTVEPNDPLYEAESNSSYYLMSGTSMATPNASGSAALLVELYKELFGGSATLSSTLKALIIHTADDLGNAGPDYAFGWGLMNAKAAADVIIQHSAEPEANTIHEGLLQGSSDMHSYTFVWDGVSDVRVTLCWTDPAAVPTLIGDDPVSRLVHDMDIRVLDSNGVLGMPYVLNRVHPDWLATTGDNCVDNVERIDVSSALLHTLFTVQVSMKANSGGNQQAYSLLVTGQEPNAHPSLIRGRVTDSQTGEPVPGVVIGGEPGGLAAETNSQGYYSLLVPYGWRPWPESGTVTPSKYGCSFEPASIDYNDVTMDIYDQDYTVTQIKLGISGTILDSNNNGVSGVRIVSDPDAGVKYSDPNGEYRIDVPYGYSGIIAPEKESMEFAPAGRSYVDVTEPAYLQDYVASGVFHRISGRITGPGGSGLPGVSITADPNDGSVVTDGEGRYRIDVVDHFAGSLRPRKQGYTMQPVSRYYGDVTEPISGEDYAVNAIFYDGFADNLKGAAWQYTEGEPNTLSMLEQSQQLQIVAAEPNDSYVLYRANGWMIDPNDPFTLKVRWRLSVTDVGEPNQIWVRFGVENETGDRAEISVGCVGAEQYFAFAAVVDGNSLYTQKACGTTDGSFYLTYDPNYDELYLSDVEYGSTKAWQTLQGVLGAAAGPGVRVYLGGSGNGVTLTTGQAHLDEVELNTGTLMGWPPAADVNKDGYITWTDVWYVTQYWLHYHGSTDVNKDGKVNFKDFALIAAGW